MIAPARMSMGTGVRMWKCIELGGSRSRLAASAKKANTSWRGRFRLCWRSRTYLTLPPGTQQWLERLRSAADVAADDPLQPVVRRLRDVRPSEPEDQVPREHGPGAQEEVWRGVQQDRDVHHDRKLMTAATARKVLVDQLDPAPYRDQFGHANVVARPHPHHQFGDRALARHPGVTERHVPAGAAEQASHRDPR